MSDIREQWIGSVVGQQLDPDRAYGCQCVDCVDHFGEFIFGVPWQRCVGGVAGARQLLDVAPDEFWTRIDYYHGFIPQRFDVLVYAGDEYNEWGHTAIVESATNTYINVVQQDGFAAPHQFVNGNWFSAKPAHRARLAYRANGTGPLLGVLRARPEKMISGGFQLSSQTTTIQEDDMANVPQEEWDWAKKVLSALSDNVATKSDLKGIWKEPIDWRNPATGELVPDATTPETVLSYVDTNTARVIDAKTIAASIPDELIQGVAEILAARMGGK